MSRTTHRKDKARRRILREQLEQQMHKAAPPGPEKMTLTIEGGQVYIHRGNRLVLSCPEEVWPELQKAYGIKVIEVKQLLQS